MINKREKEYEMEALVETWYVGERCYDFLNERTTNVDVLIEEKRYDNVLYNIILI